VRYTLSYRNTAFDLWKLSMRGLYSPAVIVCNLVATATLVVLTVTRWHALAVLVRIALLALCVLFPTTQPLVMYLRTNKQNVDMLLVLDGKGISVSVGDQTELVPWSNVCTVDSKPGYIVFYCGRGRGYLVPDRALPVAKTELIKFIQGQVRVYTKRR
jgi:hypothetical protein